jgi:hypothetical protein
MANPVISNLDGSNPGPAGISTVNTQLLFSTGQSLQTIYVTMTPTIVATISTVEESFGLNGVIATATTGIKPGDIVIGASPPSSSLVAVSGFRVDGTTADKFYVSFTNPTAGGITPPSGVWAITVLRPTTFNAAAQGTSVLG